MIALNVNRPSTPKAEVSRMYEKERSNNISSTTKTQTDFI